MASALDSKDDTLLKDFADSIVPSPHILYFLKTNLLSHKPLEHIDVTYVRTKYYEALLRFKQNKWNIKKEIFDRASLTYVTDFKLYEKGYVNNRRNEDWAFGDVRFMEKLLRNAYRINGFWISSYFMNRYFVESVQ